jgi:hypothetical protein
MVAGDLMVKDLQLKAKKKRERRKRKKRSRYKYELRIYSLVSEKTHERQNYFLFENVERGSDRRSRTCSLWSV